MLDAKDFIYGFRVEGSVHQARKRVNWYKAFKKHCEGDLSTNEAYLSAWMFGPELEAHLKERGRVAGFLGPTWTDWIAVDIDGTGNDPLENALVRTRRLLWWLEKKTAAALEALPCWFSGNKGFHVLLPVKGLCAEPGLRFDETARAFVAFIGSEVKSVGGHDQSQNLVPDLSIYDKVRIIRAPNTKHPRTDFYKVSIPADALLKISADGVRKLASSPRPTDAPEPKDWCDWNARDWWSKAQAVVQEDVSRAKTNSLSRTALNRDTMDCVRNGFSGKNREVSFFQFAANLAEFGADERMVVALLQDHALDSGLSPKEIRHAFATGVKHGQRQVA